MDPMKRNDQLWGNDGLPKPWLHACHNVFWRKQLSIRGFIIRRGKKDNLKGSDKILFLNLELTIILKILCQGRT